MNYCKSLFLLIMTLVFSTVAMGKSNNPQELAKEYFSAMKSEGMTSAGRFMHPNALSEFKSMLMPVYKVEAESGERQLMDITFGKHMTISKLEKIEPEAFMNGFMNLIASNLGDVKIRFDKLEILGTIKEGEARHVLTRMTVGVGELETTQFEVLSFIPYKDSWRLQLNGNIKGMANALRAKINSK